MELLDRLKEAQENYIPPELEIKLDVYDELIGYVEDIASKRQ